ncbi:hypothetical protein Cme02nite_74630 [Catellatospora methionotrophica]|uniref:Beta-lactamase n=1 Tax=Catellatospora methionotrophica TaxID=121620 RepID=A0A8J3LPL9_9ACTN|nr:hypothetical protein [Catellatospora methionotrophica]GIG19131.1 hypothetical protein Cme02nite_74630 [Catellatospora methionotrophica]
MTEHTRRRALLAGGVGVAALATGGLWLAGRGGADPGAAALWHDPPAPVDTTPATVPAQPGPPKAERARILTAANAGDLIKITTSGWYSWALMDRATGEIVGAKNLSETNMTASMIKAWLAADYLRRATDAGQTPSAARFAELRKLIRDSDNAVATALWTELGGRATITRLISICKLTDSAAGPDWSKTQLSARDTCRIAHAIGTGTAAGSRWTDYLIGEMRAVRGEGTFGIRRAFPAAEQPKIAIKNGWVWRGAPYGFWNVNCLALGDTWTMAVLTRYASGGQQHGENIAQSVATQLRTLSSLL